MHELYFFNICFTITIKYCPNLFFGGRATRDLRMCLPKKENARNCHQRLFEENVREKSKGVYKF